MSTLNEYLNKLPSVDQAKLESIIDDFEDAWEQGQQPNIEDHLPSEGAERWAVLIDLVHVDLERRLKAGETVLVEDYLDRYPELIRDHGVVFELIIAEYEVRRKLEPDVALDEYRERFPYYNSRIDHQLAGKETPELKPSANTTVPLPGAPKGGSSPRENVRLDAPADRSKRPRSSGLRYHPVRLHATGGLGEVFVAQDEELNREVALKRIQAQHAADEESRRRFLLEAEVTGRLEHPGIVPVYGLVENAEGQLCYAMRLVRGETLHDAIKRFHDQDQDPKRDPGERVLSLRQLLSRFIAVCNTVAYAHSRGILHRDLKPANVLLGNYGETLVVDWGLAKPIDRVEQALTNGEDTLRPALTHGVDLTHRGQVLGTPIYMSPEQADGKWDKVGMASDVYSLGATLYHLLTGQTPCQGSNVEEILKKVKEGDFLPPRKVNARIPHALQAICLKAMAKEPADRYPTLSALADDIEHWLADEPVSAHREPFWTRLDRWNRKHPAWAARCGWVATLLVATAAAVAIHLGFRELNRIQHHAQQANEERRTIERKLDQALHNRGLDLCDHGDAAKGILCLAKSLEGQQADAGDLPPTPWQDPAHWRAHVHPLKKVLPYAHPARVAALFPHPNGTTLATASADGIARLWEREEDKLSLFGREFKHENASILAVAISRDKQYLATGGTDKTAQIWRIDTGRSTGSLLRHNEPVRALALGFDKNYEAVTADDKTIRQWDWVSKVENHPLPHRGVAKALAISGDGKVIVALGEDKVARLWNARTREPHGMPLPLPGTVTALAVSPEGKMLLSGCQDGILRLWDVMSGQSLGSMMRIHGSVQAVAFSSDSKTVLAIGQWPEGKTVAGQLRIWEINPVPPSQPSTTSPAKRSAFTPEQVTRLVLWSEVLTGMELEDRFDGSCRFLKPDEWKRRHAQLEDWRKKNKKPDGPPL